MNKPTVKLRKESLDKVQKTMSDAEFSKLINISAATLSRIKNDKEEPGKVFIAALLSAFPKKKFEHFFFLD